MRAYTVATVAITLGVTSKWLDNALSRFPVRGVIQGRQGIRRRLGPQAVVTLYIACELNRLLGIPLGDAISLAERATAAGGLATISLFSSASITVDVTATAREVGERLAQAVEVTPVPRRGRPPTK
jgi:hypothetical protein